MAIYTNSSILNSYSTQNSTMIPINETCDYDYFESDYHFESIIKALRADVTSISIQFTLDTKARAAYTKSVAEMASKLRAQVLSGKISWHQAAKEANKTRNTIMEIMRTKSTPIGRAIAEKLKKEGKTLAEMLSRKSHELFGKEFNQLATSQQNKVYAEVVKSAGKANPKWSYLMKKVSYAGKALIVISVAISVHNIATAEDKVAAATREASVAGGGILGGAAGGAAAGLACGPGAPVCVTAGALIGGVAGAFGVDYIFFD